MSNLDVTKRNPEYRDPRPDENVVEVTVKMRVRGTPGEVKWAREAAHALNDLGQFGMFRSNIDSITIHYVEDEEEV